MSAVKSTNGVIEVRPTLTTLFPLRQPADVSTTDVTFSGDAIPTVDASQSKRVPAKLPLFSDPSKTKMAKMTKQVLIILATALTVCPSGWSTWLMLVLLTPTWSVEQQFIPGVISAACTDLAKGMFMYYFVDATFKTWVERIKQLQNSECMSSPLTRQNIVKYVAHMLNFVTVIMVALAWQEWAVRTQEAQAKWAQGTRYDSAGQVLASPEFLYPLRICSFFINCVFFPLSHENFAGYIISLFMKVRKAGFAGDQLAALERVDAAYTHINQLVEGYGKLIKREQSRKKLASSPGVGESGALLSEHDIILFAEGNFMDTLRTICKLDNAELLQDPELLGAFKSTLTSSGVTNVDRRALIGRLEVVRAMVLLLGIGTGLVGYNGIYDIAKQLLKQWGLPEGVQIIAGVMTMASMAAAFFGSINALFESFRNWYLGHQQLNVLSKCDRRVIYAFLTLCMGLSIPTTGYMDYKLVDQPVEFVIPAGIATILFEIFGAWMVMCIMSSEYRLTQINRQQSGQESDKIDFKKLHAFIQTLMQKMLTQAQMPPSTQAAVTDNQV